HGQVRRRPLDTPEALVPRRLKSYVLEGALEAGEPLDHRAPGRDLLVRLDEEAEGVLHLLEGLARLHEPTESQLAPEVAGCGHDRGDDPRPQSVAGCEIGHPLLPAHDAPPVAHHTLESLAKAPKLVPLAVVERDPFGVLPEADKAEAEVGFEPL